MKTRFPPGYWAKPRRHPYQLCIAAMCFLSGAGFVTTGQASASMETMPVVLQYAWAWSLLVTATLILCGAFWSDDDDSCWPELAGHLGLAFLTLGYGVGVIFYFGLGGFGGAVLFAITLAAGFRAWTLFNCIRHPGPSHDELVVEQVKKLAAEHAKTEQDTGPQRVVQPDEGEK